MAKQQQAFSMRDALPLSLVGRIIVSLEILGGDKKPAALGDIHISSDVDNPNECIEIISICISRHIF